MAPPSYEPPPAVLGYEPRKPRRTIRAMLRLEGYLRIVDLLVYIIIGTAFGYVFFQFVRYLVTH